MAPELGLNGICQWTTEPHSNFERAWESDPGTWILRNLDIGPLSLSPTVALKLEEGGPGGSSPEGLVTR